jgi:hypothetical protein
MISGGNLKQINCNLVFPGLPPSSRVIKEKYYNRLPSLPSWLFMYQMRLTFPVFRSNITLAADKEYLNSILLASIHK